MILIQSDPLCYYLSDNKAEDTAIILGDLLLSSNLGLIVIVYGTWVDNLKKYWFSAPVAPFESIVTVLLSPWYMQTTHQSRGSLPDAQQ